MQQAGPRFTIRSLMIAVAVVAGLLAPALSPKGLTIALGSMYFFLACDHIWHSQRSVRSLPPLAGPGRGGPSSPSRGR
jgi:hypothetical protein